MSKEELVKLRVELPDAEDGVGGEGLWAKPLGNDLYEIRNSPWHSREINYLDVVKAIAPTEDRRPEILSVERRGGHRTIQVIILPDGEAKRATILAKLKEFGGTYEEAHSTLYAFDFKPGTDWEPTLEYLEEMLAQNLADYRYSTY